MTHNFNIQKQNTIDTQVYFFSTLKIILCAYLHSFDYTEMPFPKKLSSR